MQYELINNDFGPAIKIAAEKSDTWTGITESTGYIENGILDCGTVTLESGKKVFLKIRIADKPKLQEIIEKLKAAKIEYNKLQNRTVKIYLSSRGCGDYSPIEWNGDITRPDTEIMAECKSALKNGHDVDSPNQPDDELLSKIRAAREKWENKDERAAAIKAANDENIKRKVESGYCFNCESYCFGDCGNYSTDPEIRYRRQLDQAQKEIDYGIND